MRILCFLALCRLAGVCRVYLLCHYNPVIGDLNFNKGSCPAESRARPRARRMKIDQWRWDTSACTVCTLQCTTAQSRSWQIYNQTFHYLKEGGMKNYWQFNTMNVFSTFYSMFKTFRNFCKILYWSVLEPGYHSLIKKTSTEYNFPLIKNNLRHYFYFLPVRVSNILKFWFVCSVNWVLSAVFLQPFYQNSLLFAKQTLFGLVLVNVFRTIGKK